MQRLGEREAGTGRLEEAVAAYRAALLEYSRERAPLDWAMTQNNLGTALQTLGAWEAGTGRLEEAVAAYSAALLEYSPERAPLDWAMSLGNQGVALALLAERRLDSTIARQAVIQIEHAHDVFRAAEHVYAVYYAVRLSEARELAGRLTRPANR